MDGRTVPKKNLLSLTGILIMGYCDRDSIILGFQGVLAGMNWDFHEILVVFF